MSERLEIIKAKLAEFDVEDIAADYLKNYTESPFDFPETEQEIPSDDCIRTLTIIKQAYLNAQQKSVKQYTLQAETVASLIKISYDQVIKSVDAVCKVLDRTREDMVPLYGKYRELIRTTENDVRELDLFLSSRYSKDVYSRLFVEALRIGVNETKRRIEALERATGSYAESVLYEMYCRNGRLGYLMFPSYYSDPVAGIEYLMERFDEADTAHILKNDFWYLYDFKEEGYFDGGVQERKQRIAELIDSYQNQIDARDKLIALQKEITPHDYDDAWDDFTKLWDSLPKNTLKYPFCPSLHNSIVWTISSFSSFMEIPKEFKQYNIKK